VTTSPVLRRLRARLALYEGLCVRLDDAAGGDRSAFVAAARERRKTAQGLCHDIAAMGPDAETLAAPVHFRCGGLLPC